MSSTTTNGMIAILQAYDRIKPTDAATIEWGHVAAKFKFLFKTEQKVWYLSENRPEISLGPNETPCRMKVNGVGITTFADSFASFKPSDVHWAKSIVARPE